MRWRGSALVVLALASVATAQVAATSSGYAMTPLLAPTISPVSTPVITFVNVSNAPVGATNGTGSNVVGASNSTIGHVPGPSNASFTFAISSLSPTEATSPSYELPRPADLLGLRPAGGASDLVAAAAEGSQERQQRGASGVRTYTNQDIERIQRQSGVSQPKGITIPTTQ